MDEKILKSLKDSYHKSTVTEKEVAERWKILQANLPEQDHKQHRSLQQSVMAHRYAFLFACLSLFFILGSLGLVTVAQNAHPGEAFYGIKVTTDNVAAKLLNKPQLKVEKRAIDIIKVTEQRPEQIEKATEEYQKALEEAKEEIQSQDTTEKQTFKSSLQNQQEQLKEIKTEDPKTKQFVEAAIKETEKTQQEVKSASASAEKERAENNHKPDNTNKPIRQAK